MGDYIGAMHEQQIADLRRDRAELDARIAQLETAGQALLDTVAEQPYHGAAAGNVLVDLDAVDQFRAVLDGNATPTAREDPPAARLASELQQLTAAAKLVRACGDTGYPSPENCSTCARRSSRARGAPSPRHPTNTR